MNRKKNIIHNLIYNRFDGGFTRQIQDWIYRNRNSRELDGAMFEVWNNIEALPGNETLKALRKTRQRIGRPFGTVRKHIINGISVAAAVSAAIMLVISIGTRNKAREIAALSVIEYVVPEGEIGNLLLPDGTSVSLNAGSVLLYPEKFTGGKRSVYLSGEGFFDVARDETMPFTVRTSRMDITALGTVFNIDAYPGNSKVVATLNSGQIAVERNSGDDDSRYILEPDQQIEYDLTTGDVVRRTVNASQVSCWTDGSMYFQNMPLCKIIPALERRFAVEIRVNSAIDQNEHYTLKFRNDEDLDYILSVLVSASGSYQYDITNNIVNIFLPKRF